MESQPLLPGLLNEITLDLIVPRLPWKATKILSSVSRRWQRAVFNREVRDARLRSNATQTHVVFQYKICDDKDGLALYSVEEKVWCKLPSIPNLDCGIPLDAQCVSLDGQIYMIGGYNSRTGHGPSAEVYVFDLAGQWKWKQAASMLEERSSFGCGIMDRKVYVLGGIFSDPFDTFASSEVYDPDEDVWSPIAPMTYSRNSHQVAAVGEQLFVYGGQPDHGDGGEMYPDVEIYHPRRNEWVAENLRMNNAVVFVAENKLHVMTETDIDVYNVDKNAWTNLHFHNLVEHVGPDYRDVAVVDDFAALVVDGEILLVTNWLDKSLDSLPVVGLLRSNGFRSGKKKITWDAVNRNPDWGWNSPVMCAIQL